MNIRKSLYSEQNDEIIDWIKRLMCTNQPALTERLIRALKGLYPTDVVEYLLGVYSLEFGGTYALGGGRYIERKVSFRRARRHLKRALRAKPQDAEILTAIGESYAKERKPALAFPFCERALALDTGNARLAWNLVEQSYLLARYETVLSCDAAFHWETCADHARIFWCSVICTYSAAALRDAKKTREFASRALENYTSELPQGDLAAACLLDALFLAGRADELKAQYVKCAQEAECVSSPLLCALREKGEWIPRQELASQILAAFTPRNLLPHLAW